MPCHQIHIQITNFIYFDLFFSAYWKLLFSFGFIYAYTRFKLFDVAMHHYRRFHSIFVNMLLLYYFFHMKGRHTSFAYFISLIMDNRITMSSHYFLPYNFINSEVVSLYFPPAQMVLSRTLLSNVLIPGILQTSHCRFDLAEEYQAVSSIWLLMVHKTCELLLDRN